MSLSIPKFAVRDKCEVCGSTDHRLFYTCTFGIEAHLCNQCGFLFAAKHQHPDATTEILKDGYADRAGDLNSAWDAEHKKAPARNRVDFLKRSANLPPSPEILEVGSHIGHFLHAARQEGWSIEGIEPEAATALFSREKTGVTVHDLLLDDYLRQSDKKFDLVCMFHVLEHLYEPVDVLTKLRSLLKEGGSICLEVPNGNHCGSGNWFKFFNADETHLWFFDTQSLSILLSRAGFTPRIFTEVPAYSGKRGALLLLAEASAPEDKPHRNATAVAKRRRSLKLHRLNYLFGTGLANRIYRKLHYLAWYLVKGWKMKSRQSTT